MRLRNGQGWKSVVPVGLITALLLTLLVAAPSLAAAEPAAAKSRKAAQKIAVFDFKEALLAEVLKVFTELTGKNVVATPEIQGLGISLYLERVSAMVALETLCKNYNLWYTREANVIRVMKVEE